MRTGDVALPAVTPHPLPPGAPIADWPYRPVIALERLPQAAYTWDDNDAAVDWDAAGYMWDAPFIGGGFTDAVCDFHALEIDPGDADELYLFPATSCTVTLDNRTGAYTPWSADGRLVYWAPGRRLAVWAWRPTPQVLSHGYLNPTASVTTPDPGVPPAAFTVVQRVRLGTPVAETWPVTSRQNEGSDPRSWQMYRNIRPDASNGGRWFYEASTTGVWANRATRSTLPTDQPAPVIGADETVAITVDNTSGRLIMRTWTYDDATATWTAHTARDTGAALAPFDVTTALRVGTGWAAGGRIYSVELRTGTDPTGGTVLWRFDADDYPGTGTSYIDPRGRTWTLSAAGVITPKVLDPANQQWLFAGRVASWTMNVDDTVTVVAYDGLAWWAQELGGDWTPGVAGQTPLARLGSIATAAGYPDPLRGDTGSVALTTSATDRPPIEAAQWVALSDGGLFYGDADGALVYRDRLWRAGRGDQPATWVISDNVCTVPVVVWDPELAADDDHLATDVRLVNAAGLVATAALAPGSSLWAGDARYRLSHPDPDLWTTQAEGDALAAYLLGQQSSPSMALAAAVLYVQDPRQAPAVWDLAVAMRRGDRVEVLHDFPDPDGAAATLDVYAIALGIGHQITPEVWTTSLALSRTVDWRAVEEWDRTTYRWDEIAVANVWRY